MKYTDLYISAKPEKVELLREFCKKNVYAFVVVVANIPQDKITEFDKFLIDNEVLADE